MKKSSGSKKPLVPRNTEITSAINDAKKSVYFFGRLRPGPLTISGRVAQSNRRGVKRPEPSLPKFGWDLDEGPKV